MTSWILMGLLAPALGQDDPPDPPGRLEAGDIEAQTLAADGSVKDDTTLADLPRPPSLDAPVPAVGEGDTWLLMDSGEWVRGGLTKMRLDRVSFASEDLGDLTIDWDDVAAFWVQTPHVWFTTDKRRLVGPARLRDDRLDVATDDGVVSLSPDEVSSMKKSDGRELGFWSYDLYAGFSGRWGNAQQLNFIGRSDLVRDDARTRLSLHYDGTYGFTQGQPSANAHNASGQLDVYVHEVLYVTPLLDEAYHDPFQNIRIRNRVGAGLGFRHEAAAVFTWSGALQGVYQYQEAISVADADDAITHDAGLSVGLDAKIAPVADMTLKLGWKTTVVLTELGLTSHRGLLAWSYKLVGALGVDTQVQYDRIEQPAPLADGTTPQSDDLQVSAGLSLSF